MRSEKKLRKWRKKRKDKRNKYLEESLVLLFKMF